MNNKKSRLQAGFPAYPIFSDMPEEEINFYEQIAQIEKRGLRKGFMMGFLIAISISVLIAIIM